MLLARVEKRDPAAFEQLYDAHHRLVYGLALRMMGDAAVAEDVTQAVFLKIWSTPGTFTDGNFGAWIARVTRNRCLDLLRSRAHRSEADIPDELPEEGALEELVFARLDAQAVQAALAQLPADQRSPIELGFFGGVTHQEIAQRLHVPLGTVKTRIRAGLRRLRILLEAGA